MLHKCSYTHAPENCAFKLVLSALTSLGFPSWLRGGARGGYFSVLLISASSSFCHTAESAHWEAC